jgi:amidase
MSDQLWTYSAIDLAAMISTRQVTSREVIDAHLDRIAAVNPELNAITVEMAEAAQAAADDADAGEPTGPLHGVPISIKENIDQVGYPTTQGVAAFAEAMPPANAPTLQSLLDAGAIPIGRTNMPELGLRVSTDNEFRGLTRNPHDFERTAGGSSGGEGSAIAAGMSPLGLGNDIGGSVRNPALCCGITALKPGYGRVPRVASLPPAEPGISAQLMAVEGPMARSVADLRLAYELLSGRVPSDPRVADAPLDGVDVVRRCGVVRHLAGTSVDTGALQAIDDAAAAMADAGYDVVEVEPPELRATHEVWMRLLAFDFGQTIPLLATFMGGEEINVLRALVELADELPGTPQQLFIERLRLQKLWSAMFAETPIVIGPGWNQPPFTHGADIVEGRQMEILDNQLSFIVPANALGLPVVAYTNGTSGGLPAGVQVYADHWREDLCLAGAAIIEAAGDPIRPIDPVWQ